MNQQAQDKRDELAKAYCVSVYGDESNNSGWVYKAFKAGYAACEEKMVAEVKSEERWADTYFRERNAMESEITSLTAMVAMMAETLKSAHNEICPYMSSEPDDSDDISDIIGMILRQALSKLKEMRGEGEK